MKNIFLLLSLSVLFVFNCEAQSGYEGYKVMMHPDTIRIYKTANDYVNHKYTEVDLKTYRNMAKKKGDPTLGKLKDQWGYVEIFGNLIETYRMPKNSDIPMLFVVCGSLCLYYEGYYYKGTLTGMSSTMDCSVGIDGDIFSFKDLPAHLNLDDNCKNLFDKIPNKVTLSNAQGQYLSSHVEFARYYNNEKPCTKCYIDLLKQN